MSNSRLSRWMREPILHFALIGALLFMAYGRMNYSAASRRTTQYYHLYGSGAIYHNGWKASFGYRPDFIDIYQSYPPPRHPVNNAGKEVWELYHVDKDPTELNDLAKSNPAKLAEMKALFDREAKANQVYPLINWTDVSVGIEDFQERSGLIPPEPATEPKK